MNNPLYLSLSFFALAFRNKCYHSCILKVYTYACTVLHDKNDIVAPLDNQFTLNSEYALQLIQFDPNAEESNFVQYYLESNDRHIRLIQ